MSDDADRRLAVRPVLDEDGRRRMVRNLLLATVVCDVLVVAVVIVGLLGDWAWWLIVLACLVPLVVGGFALQASIVLRRAQNAP